MLPKPYGFQQKTIDRLTDVTIENGACFLFDETGLGKTIIAAHIAKNVSNGGKVMVVSPKTNINAWKSILPDADVFTKQKVEFNPYDVVIVDEAHGYRNRDGKQYEILHKTIWEGNPDKFPYVIIVTATPFNNNVLEFASIFSLCPLRPSGTAFWALGFGLEAAHLSEKNLLKFRRYKSKTNKDELENITKISRERYRLSNQLECIGRYLKNISSRNRRVDIEEYSDRFPKTEKLDDIRVKFSSEIVELIQLTIVRINNCTFEDYNPDENEIPYEAYKTDESSNYNGVAGFLKTFLYKRLDSSAAAFVSSLKRMVKKVPENSNDQYQIQAMISDWKDMQDIFDDQKAKSIASLISEHGKKVVVFTEYIETGDILSKKLASLLNEKVMYFTSKKMDDEDAIEELASEFDANYLGVQTNKYRILVATDALSEGANLHRASLLIHYDQRWNPSRSIQREGRINRLFRDAIVPGLVNTCSVSTNAHIEGELGLMRRTEEKIRMANSIFDFSDEYNIPKNAHGIVFPSGIGMRYTIEGFFWVTYNIEKECKRQGGPLSIICDLNMYIRFGNMGRNGSLSKAESGSLLQIVYDAMIKFYKNKYEGFDPIPFNELKIAHTVCSNPLFGNAFLGERHVDLKFLNMVERKFINESYPKQTMDNILEAN
jgi:superfamily II DNA or RNA helicase